MDYFLYINLLDYILDSAVCGIVELQRSSVELNIKLFNLIEDIIKSLLNGQAACNSIV